eukprot:15464631-Alexandrium_andersonii.AAC.1
MAIALRLGLEVGDSIGVRPHAAVQGVLSGPTVCGRNVNAVVTIPTREPRSTQGPPGPSIRGR